jgi:hypothetical protein
VLWELLLQLEAMSGKLKPASPNKTSRRLNLMMNFDFSSKWFDSLAIAKTARQRVEGLKFFSLKLFQAANYGAAKAKYFISIDLP